MFIASGPTYPDKSTYSEALDVLKKYALLEHTSKNILSLLQRGSNHKLAKTPNSLNNAFNYIIGENLLALDSMSDKARQLGFNPLILTD